MWLDELEQALPGHNQLLLFQEDLPAGLLPLACVRETDLAHHLGSSGRVNALRTCSVDLIRDSLTLTEAVFDKLLHSAWRNHL